MSDLDTMRAMFNRAGIPYKEARATGAEELPSLEVVGQQFSPAYPSQPHPGGYEGFINELVFTVDGDLYAVWAWE